MPSHWRVRRVAKREQDVSFYYIHHSPSTEFTFLEYEVVSLPTVVIFDSKGQQIDMLLCTVQTLNKLTEMLAKRTWGV